MCEQKATVSILVTALKLLGMKFCRHNISRTYVIYGWTISLLQFAVRMETVLGNQCCTINFDNCTHTGAHSKKKGS
jgi:hypothetical protein